MEFKSGVDDFVFWILSTRRNGMEKLKGIILWLTIFCKCVGHSQSSLNATARTCMLKIVLLSM